MLTKKQLKQLRNEIVFNSLFIKDYNNTLFIKPETACAFFSSFMEYIEEEYYDVYGECEDYNALFNKYDNIDTLYNYYLFFEYDPLLQDNFIASMPINNSDSIVIYEATNDYVLVAYYCLSGLCMKNTKIKRYKLYYSDKGYYFMLNKRRYYIDNFTRVYKC